MVGIFLLHPLTSPHKAGVQRAVALCQGFGGVYTGRLFESGVQGCSPWWGFGGIPQASLSFAAGGEL